MIVRDEEAMLPDCLRSARRAVDRIVVVDTGSRDGTRDVARSFGAELVEFPWQDDFAAARNAGLERVATGYVLVLDADERLTPRGARRLRAVARRGEIDLGLLPLHDAASVDARVADVLSGEARLGEPMLLPRLLRRTADLRYDGIVHESVAAWAARGRKVQVVRAPVVHYGATASLRAGRAKSERNRRLLERRCDLEPDNPIPFAYLAVEYQRAGSGPRALEAAERSWRSWLEARRRDERHDPVFPASVFAQLALGFERIDDARAAVAAALEVEEHPNLQLLAGICEEHRVLRQGAGGEALARAARHYRRCLELDGQLFASEQMPGATSWQAATRLGTVELHEGRFEAAREAFERALGAREELAEARLGRVEALIGSGRADQALAGLEPLLDEAEPDPDAWLLAARAARRVGSAADARIFLERARAARTGRGFVAAHRDRQLVALERELGEGESSQADASAGRTDGQLPCLFAWPSYQEREDLDVLLGEFGELFAEHPGLVLCLRHDASVDGDRAEAEAALTRAYTDHLGQGCRLEVVLVDQPLASSQVAELAGPGDVALELPHTRGVRRRFLAELGARKVDSVASLRQALGGAA